MERLTTVHSLSESLDQIHATLTFQHLPDPAGHSRVLRHEHDRHRVRLRSADHVVRRLDGHRPEAHRRKAQRVHTLLESMCIL